MLVAFSSTTWKNLHANKDNRTFIKVQWSIQRSPCWSLQSQYSMFWPEQWAISNFRVQHDLKRSYLLCLQLCFQRCQPLQYSLTNPLIYSLTHILLKVTSRSNLGNISVTSQSQLSHNSDTSQSHFSHISFISKSYLKHILVTSQLYLSQNSIKVMSQSHLCSAPLESYKIPVNPKSDITNHISVISHSNLGHISVTSDSNLNHILVTFQ